MVRGGGSKMGFFFGREIFLMDGWMGFKRSGFGFLIFPNSTPKT